MGVVLYNQGNWVRNRMATSLGKMGCFQWLRQHQHTEILEALGEQARENKNVYFTATYWKKKRETTIYQPDKQESNT